uniref:Uncharacterized protein n=1 Tax=Brassica oleracea var. oleracea TaxID=109376 RepID=A0A0D3D7C7_BRAOL
MESIRRYMVEGDEQHVSGELSRVEEADISGTTSTSIDGMTSMSTDGTTSTSTNGWTSTSIDNTTSTSSNVTTSTSIGSTTSTSTNDTTSTSIDDVEKEITMEDFLDLEEFLDLEDGEKLEDLDSSREVTMEDFLELEEWLEGIDQNSEKKLDDDQHTSKRDLETSSRATIDRHQPDEIDRQPPDIDRHRQPIIDRHHPPNIDRCPLLDVTPSCIVEMEPIEERMHKSEASHLAVHVHLRPPICAEEAFGFHKRVKKIYDPVKIVVPCDMFEVEFPIPPDKGAHLSSYVEVFDDPLHAKASQRGLRFRDEVDKGPAEAASIDTDRIPSIDTTTSPSIDTTTSSSIDSGRVTEQKEFNVCGRDGDTTTRSDKSEGKKRRNWKKRKRIKDGPQVSLIPRFSDGVRKSRVRSKCFSKPFAKLRALLIAEMIDKGEESMDEAFTQE